MDGEWRPERTKPFIEVLETGQPLSTPVLHKASCILEPYWVQGGGIQSFAMPYHPTLGRIINLIWLPGV